MQAKTILIIGGGIAGLSAGCYARMNGYESHIFELHTLPGGLCTGWQRKGYTFDGCIHWLVGSGRGKQMSDLWRELGALEGKQIVDHEEYLHFTGRDGRTVIFYTDVDRLERHLLELAPQDARLIRDMAKAIRKLSRFKPPLNKPRELMKPGEAMLSLPAMLPVMGIFKKYGSITLEQFAAGFKSPLLREALPAVVMNIAGFPALGILMMLAYMHDRNAGFPLGGSLAFSQNIERRYRNLGGQIHYKARVGKVLVEGGHAVGVRLEDGREFRGDLVISAADGYATIFKMLEGKYVDDAICGYYRDLPIFRPLVQVSLGVKRDLTGQPNMVVHPLAEPITIAGEKREFISIKHFCYDPSLAPNGKSVVEVMYPCDYDYWKPFEGDAERYEAEKKQAAITILGQLERILPGIEKDVEVIDVATPLTYERYTGNWQGSMEGWLITPDTMAMQMQGKAMSKTLPGLQDFYMIGQWVEPGGGVPTAALSARNVMQMICHKDGKPFATQEA
jgi:phytoene dehydrogenase-like protein